MGKVRIALLGLGTVGQGVWSILSTKRIRFKKAAVKKRFAKIHVRRS
jgi:homoserine dehydrogenase